MGDQIGKLGPAVGRKWKGRMVYASYQKYVANPRTMAQQLIRSRFAVISGLASAFTSAIQLGLEQLAKSAAVTEGNAFIKMNWDKVTAVSPDDVSVNYPALNISHGALPEVSFGQVDFGEGEHLHVEAPMNGGTDQPGANNEDQVFLFAYCPDRKQGILGSAVPRSATKASVNVPQAWDGMEIHVYGFAVSAVTSRKRIATSTCYCGTGEVA